MSLESFTFTTLIEQGYKIVPATVEQAEYDHRLFGAQSIDALGAQTVTSHYSPWRPSIHAIHAWG